MSLARTVPIFVAACLLAGCQISSPAKLDYLVQDYRSMSIESINKDLAQKGSEGWAFDRADVWAPGRPPVIVFHHIRSGHSAPQCMIRDYRGYDSGMLSKMSRELSTLGNEGWKVVDLVGSGGEQFPYVILCRKAKPQ